MEQSEKIPAEEEQLVQGVPACAPDEYYDQVEKKCKKRVDPLPPDPTHPNPS